MRPSLLAPFVAFASLVGCSDGSPPTCSGVECDSLCDERSDSTLPQTARTFGLGHPCGASADCVDGLECEYVKDSAWRVCTRDCETEACATGSTCVTALSARMGDAGMVNRRLCAPSCDLDVDCSQQARSSCKPQTDAQLPKLCTFVPCYTDEDCGGIQVCVGASCARGGGDAPNVPGFCHAY